MVVVWEKEKQPFTYVIWSCAYGWVAPMASRYEFKDFVTFIDAFSPYTRFHEVPVELENSHKV